MRTHHTLHYLHGLILGPFKEVDLRKDLLSGVGGEASINPKEGDTPTQP